MLLLGDRRVFIKKLLLLVTKNLIWLSYLPENKSGCLHDLMYDHESIILDSLLFIFFFYFFVVPLMYMIIINFEVLKYINIILKIPKYCI